MAKFSTIQNNFLAGELGPRIKSRTDIDEMKQGCASMINFIPRPGGGASYRPGFQYVKTPTLNASPTRFAAIEFHVDQVESFYVILDPEHATAASRIQCIRNDGNTVAITATFGSPYAELANAVVGVEDYYGFRYAQKGNLLVITHTSGTMKPLILFRGSNGGFYLAEWGEAINLIPGATQGPHMYHPYGEENAASGLSMTPSAITGAITITASSAYFNSGMVGARIRIREGAVEGVARITSYTSTTVVNATVEINFVSISARFTWRISSWCDYFGWPKYVTFFEQRLIFLGNTEFPDGVWCSALGNIFLMMQDVLAQDASTDVSTYNYFGSKASPDPFSFFPASNEMADIRWVTSARTLHIGTGKEEFSVDGSNGTFAFNSLSIKSQTNVGGSNCNAVRVMNSTFYVTADGKKVREFAYSEENGSYLSKDLTILNEDILDQGYDSSDSNLSLSDVKILALKWNPSYHVLFALVGGSTSSSLCKIIGFAYDKTLNLRGWFRIDTDAQIYNMCNVVNFAGNHVELWVGSKRTLDSTATLLIEKLGPIPYNKSLFRAGNNDEDRPFYLDCSKKVTLASTTSFTGFTHLKNEEVSIIVGGVYLGEKTVSNTGVITLDTAATEVIAGFKYTGTLKTMPINEGSRIGDPRVLFKKIDRIILHLFRSLGGYFGFREDNLNDIEYPDFTDDVYTGDSIALGFDSTPNEDHAVTIIKDDPSPFNLLGISVRGMTEDL